MADVDKSVVMEPLATTPKPPFVAVIFTSVRTNVDDSGYGEMAEDMEVLSRLQPGYLGIESAREPGSRLGITVSYWASEADARIWKSVTGHLGAQRLGRERWYATYRVRIATVTREYGR